MHVLFLLVQGDEIFQALLTAGLEKKVNIRIAQNFPSQSQSSPDTEILAKAGAAEVHILTVIIFTVMKLKQRDFWKY